MGMHFNENNQSGKGTLAKTSFTKCHNISATFVGAKYDHFIYRNTSKKEFLTYLHERQGHYHHRKKPRKKCLYPGHEPVYSGI